MNKKTISGYYIFKFILIISIFGTYSLSFSQTGTLIATVEAENGILSGGVLKASSIAGFSGTGYVTNFTNATDMVTVTVNVPSRAFYAIYIRYHSTYEKRQYFYVNSEGTSEVIFNSTGNNWGLVNVGKYILNEGNNTLTIKSSWGWSEIDQFKVYTTTLNSYNNTNQFLNDSNATIATQSLYNFLLYHYGKRLISGQTDGAFYDTIKNITGKSPLYRTWDFAHYTEGYPYLWKNGGFTFGIDTNDKSTDNAITWYKSTGRKGIVGFHWHWCSPSGGTAGKNTFYSAYTTFDVSKAVQIGTTEYNLIIRDIDAIAVQLKKLQTQGVPVLWRPLHEAGGEWFWWGAKGATSCKQLWNIMYDRLMNYHQLHNLIWIWSTPEPEWYPGDKTVDIIGYDSYPGDYNYTTQKNWFDQLYSITSGKKIIAMSENGPIPNPDDCLDLDSPWSVFMSWNDLVQSQNSRQHIRDIYNNNRVLTLENDTVPMITGIINNSVCDSGTVSISATSNFGSVKWYNSPTGDTAIYTGYSFITPKIYKTNTYFAEASYNNKPGELKRIPVKASVIHKVDSLNIKGITSVCKISNNHIYSTELQSDIDNYIWTIPPGATGNSSSNSINISFGNYASSGYVTVKGQNLCGSGPVDFLYITVNPTPETPIISQSADTLKSNIPTGNQWYFNGNALTYSIHDTCRVILSGNYYSIVTQNGCPSLPSNIITAYPTIIKEKISDIQINIFPNPFNESFKLISKNKKFFHNDISLYDTKGVYLKSYHIPDNTNEFKINLKEYPAGIYLLKFNTQATIKIYKY